MKQVYGKELCLTELKALEKLIVARIVLIGLGLSNLKWTEKERKFVLRVDHPGQKSVWQGERMELDSRKKSKCDRMMCSKSFETQEVRDRPEGNSGVERLSV